MIWGIFILLVLAIIYAITAIEDLQRDVADLQGRLQWLERIRNEIRD